MSKIFSIIFIIIFIIRDIILINANDINDTYINTSNIIYDEKKNIVELAENSKININNTNILVDRGVIDYNNNKIEIFGNFYLYQELNILSGKNLVGDLSLNNFTTNEVSYIYNNDLKIDSDKAIRSKSEVIFYNNFLTPCELEGFFNCPTWSLRIDETRYDIDRDKFDHFDSFLQIADYKVLYLPYFSHYGSKAPRQKGFLTPTLEFNIGGDPGIITPYYFPLKEDTDIIFKPKLIFDNNFNYIDKYTLNTIIEHKNKGGDIFIEIYNEKLEDNSNTYSSLKFNAKQVLNKRNILSYEALITNSVSTTRSINKQPSTFEDIFIRLDSYDVFYKSDYLRSEISTVEALDNTNSGLIPLTPSIKYSNQKLIKDDLTFNNEINIINLKRNESKIGKPSEIILLKTSNSIKSNFKTINSIFYNKVNLNNNIGSYYYQHNPTLDDEVFRSNLNISSDIFFHSDKNVKPRIKIVQNLNLLSDNVINEDSKAVTFNYHNQFSDSRFYGTDLEDNSSRLIYGLENDFNLNKNKVSFNINQSYDFDKGTNYLNQINQKSNFSDLAIEAATSFDKFSFKLDSRLSNRELEKKEMNYFLNYSNFIDLKLNYNETDAKAFKGLSTDTKSLGTNLEKKINDNLILSLSSDIDLKNNYSPFKQTIKLSLFDECSKLDISYVDERFNDNYNTKPSETINISFSMDYLGFFGYEQNSNVFFEEAGNFKYDN